MDALFCKQLRLALRENHSRLPGREKMEHAAVSVILVKSSQAPELVFIRRADRPNAPWSGQMAFPGGRQAASDKNEQATAARETLEEIGLDLEKHGLYLGPLRELQGRRGGELLSLCIAPQVYQVDNIPEWKLDHREVESAHRIPLTHFLDPQNHFNMNYESGPIRRQLPAVRWQEHVIWGLTYMILTDLFRLLKQNSFVQELQQKTDSGQPDRPGS